MTVFDKLADQFEANFKSVVAKMRAGDMISARFIAEGALRSLETWVISDALEVMKKIEERGGVRLISTSPAYPESYKAAIGDEAVAGLSLEFGRFTVIRNGSCIYASQTDGEGKFNGYERSFFLKAAERAIAEAYVRDQINELL